LKDILDGIRQNVSGISDRARRTWSRSPLNVAVCKMRFESVRMLVGEAGLEVNSVDEINHCERSVKSFFCCCQDFTESILK
jgi:hypothetical protein